MEGRAPRSDAAGAVDGAVLPGRGHGPRGRAPALRLLPAPGLQCVLRGVAAGGGPRGPPPRVWRGRAGLDERPRAGALDAQLHLERVRPRSRTKRTFTAAPGELPDGARIR